MTRTELATEAWRAWAKDKPLQSEDMAKGFQEGFNFCLLGKIKVEGGDKGELISANFLLRDRLTELEQENAELKSIAQFQQSSTMDARLEDTLTVGSTWNKHLNAQNQALKVDRDKYRNMVFDKMELLDKACKHLENILGLLSFEVLANDYSKRTYVDPARQFLTEVK